MKKRIGVQVSILAAATWLVCTVIVSTPAMADSKAEAKAAFMQGVDAFGNENYPGALAAFEKSYRIRKKASVLYNIGMCQKALYRYSDSLKTFKKYLKEGAGSIKPQRKSEVKEAINEMEQLVGKLVLRDAPKGAEVLINGKSVGKTPFNQPILLDPGRHTIEIKKKNFESLRTDVTSASGAVVSLRAALATAKARLKVECNEEKGLVFVDGKTVGGCPYDGAIEPGTRVISIEAPSKKTFEKEVEAISGGTSIVSATLEADPDAAIAPAAVGSPAQAVLVKSTRQAWQDLTITAKNTELPREERIEAIDDFLANYTVAPRYVDRATSWRDALKGDFEPESHSDANFMRTKKEYVSLRGYLGNYGGGARIDFSTRRWKWFFLGGFVSGGGGFDDERPAAATDQGDSTRFWLSVGLSLGIPFHIGAKKHHEIRVGVGAALGGMREYDYKISDNYGYEEKFYGMSVMIIIVPEIYYVWHIAKRFAIQVGADMYYGPLSADAFSSSSDENHETAVPIINGFIGVRF